MKPGIQFGLLCLCLVGFTGLTGQTPSSSITHCKSLGLNAKTKPSSTIVRKSLEQVEGLKYLNPSKALDICNCLEQLNYLTNSAPLEKARFQNSKSWLSLSVNPYTAYYDIIIADLKNSAIVFRQHHDFVGLARTYHLLAQAYSFQIKPNTKAFDWRIDSAEQYVALAFDVLKKTKGDPNTINTIKGEIFNTWATVLLNTPRDYELARARLDSSLFYFQKAKFFPGIANAHLNLSIAVGASDHKKHWNQAVQLYKKMGYVHDLAYAHLVLLSYSLRKYQATNEDEWLYEGEKAFRDFTSLRMRPRALGVAYTLYGKLYIHKAELSSDSAFVRYYLQHANEQLELALGHSKAEADWHNYSAVVMDLSKLCLKIGDCSELLRYVSKDYYYAIDTIKQKAALAERQSQAFQRAQLGLKNEQNRQIIIGSFLILVFVLVSMLYNLRLKNKLVLEQERTATLEARESTRKARLKTHFISNVVNNIKYLIDLEQYPAAKKSLLQFEEYFRSVLEFTEKTTVSLEKDKQLNEQYIELARLGYDDAVQFAAIDIQGLDFPVENIEVSPLLAQPDIENAIKHGILKKRSRKGRLSIYLRAYDQHRLEYLIEDDGEGLDRTKKMRSKTQQNYSGQGGKIVEDALLILNKKNKVPEGKESQHPLGAFRTISSNNGQKGTRVSIVFPYHLIEPSYD